jgi:hypothetical protein
LGDPLWFFTHLGGFDHAASDAALRARHVDIRINLHKSPADVSIYGGASAFAVWIVCWIAVAYVGGDAQVTAVTQYMGTCRALLSAP